MKSSTYQAYLLRLWRDGEHQPWRAQLENPHTGEQYCFANLEKAFVYLKGQTASEHNEANERNQ